MADESALRVETSRESAVLSRLEVEVPAERVRRAFQRAYRDLARRARVPGFRPGKVPRSVLESKFGPVLREEIERALVSESLPEAVEQSGLRPVTEPAIDASAPEDGAPFRYSAQVEVKPEIELPELEGLPGQRPPQDVGDAELLTELERLREGNARVEEEPEGTEAANGHILKVDFVGRVGGEPFEGGSGQDVEVELGSERFIPGFAEQLAGAQAGDDREVRVSFPEDYANADLAGKEAVFAVHVASVQRRELPELDDEFAKDLGEFDDLAALRARVRADLEQARTRAAENRLRGSVLESLLARTSFDVPAGLIERRLQRQLSRAHEELQGRVPEDALHAQLDQWREAWRSGAEKEVREALVLEAVAAQLGLEASDTELDERIASLAEEQGVDAKRLRSAYRDGGLLEALRVQILDDKGLAFLCEHAQVEEVADEASS
jgi:trigger factor